MVFVGDGVNDVLTIREAFVGIAMGKASDIAKNGGDVVSIFNDMRDVVEIHELSGKVNEIALENLTWVFAYNAMLIPMATRALYSSHCVFLKPEWATLAMILSDILVIANPLKLVVNESSWRH